MAAELTRAPEPPRTAPAPPPRTTGARTARRAARAARRRRSARPWLLMAPALLAVGGLLLWPLGRVVWMSFQDYGLREIVTGTTNFTGTANYAEILGSSYLWTTVLPNTVLFAAACVALTVVLGTLVALLLHRLGRLWRTVTASVLMMAWAMPAVTGTYVWVWLFDPLGGAVVQGLGAFGLVEPTETNWFTGRLSFYAIATLNVVHHGFPFVAVTVFAGLLTIPRELHEAGVVDGANAWQRFWAVTVPSIRPVFLVVIILSTIWDMKVFVQLYLMPGGDGANPEVLNLGVWSYVESFAQRQYGMGAAIAVLLTLLLLGVTVLYIRALLRESEEL
ncbi:sugar ABC transporter permease [Streptomyces sp. TRM 70351]|uniref:carbohydrate ABC transporter permease n=1 Tax=Streptomyces sp. TRM 70351 TaxID=3116552 RepID=UPI002E7B3A8A|nr:sugar ABC transporter permease [Streptomyces sp. TRM 70351]MEE1930492.1 sugar ABC transporter permease [Streptomyces sp. TRM 70351]